MAPIVYYGASLQSLQFVFLEFCFDFAHEFGEEKKTIPNIPDTLCHCDLNTFILFGFTKSIGFTYLKTLWQTSERIEIGQPLHEFQKLELPLSECLSLSIFLHSPDISDLITILYSTESQCQFLQGCFCVNRTIQSLELQRYRLGQCALMITFSNIIIALRIRKLTSTKFLGRSS